MGLVFFDFDGTLTSRDTILPLALFVGRQARRSLLDVGCVAGAAALLRLRVLSNHRFKEQFCRSLLLGESQDRVECLAADFLAQRVIGLLRMSTVDRLREHRRAGDEVFLVSSNFDFALRPVQRHLEADGVIATEAEVVGGMFTGRLAGRSCAGREKLRRVLARFGPERVAEAVAYGDSRDDADLLAMVRTRVWVQAAD
jgi:HAD superfamily hydrolase (TIGR01490 family)